MNAEQERLYRQAEEAFRAGEAARALAMLQQLAPDAGGDERVARAIALCRQRLPTVISEDLLGLQPQAPERPRPAGIADYLPDAKQAALAVVLLVVAIAGFAMNQQASEEFRRTAAIAQGLPELPPPPPGALAITVVQYVVTGYFAVFLATFVGLFLLDEMPGTDFNAALYGVAVAALYALPFLAVPVVGWVALATLVKRKCGCGWGAVAKAAVAFCLVAGLVGGGLNLAVQAAVSGLEGWML